VRVLNFHGIIDRSQRANHFASLFADTEVFEEQAALIAKRGRPVSLEEIEASLSNGHCLPDDAVHVSFDDGYRNNLRAAEILDRHRIPWSLFVVVESVLAGYQPWFLRLADAVEATTNVMLRDGSVLDTSDRAGKRRFARLAKVEIMAARDGDQDGALERVLGLRGVQLPAGPGWPLLDIADLKELDAAGVEIGNHSAHHRNLNRCPDSDLRDEVIGARQRLEGALGSPVRYFAYPDGRHDRRVRAVVGEDHALGLATWTVRPPETRLALRRYEPTGAADLAAILDSPEPWYGRRWARWTLPGRAREVGHRVRSVLSR
jgi:peptidoglycan/xylan/chitin deacetylase (PgdA/CDA1 family)